jgi:hypothetical protein
VSQPGITKRGGGVLLSSSFSCRNAIQLVIVPTNKRSKPTSQQEVQDQDRREGRSNGTQPQRPERSTGTMTGASGPATSCPTSSKIIYNIHMNIHRAQMPGMAGRMLDSHVDSWHVPGRPPLQGSMEGGF